MSAEKRALAGLAQAYGVQLSYTDTMGGRRRASDEALVATLRALGVALETPADAPAALRAREQERTQRGLAPVSVAWDGRFAPISLNLPRAARAEITLETEDGEHRHWTSARDGRISFAAPLPLGRHRLTVEAAGQRHEMTILSAPSTAWQPAERGWGMFAPTYALARDGACIGGFRELHELARWVHDAGGSIVGTLPLLAAFLAEPFEPSPYAPASRLFWNELFVDADRLGAPPSNERCNGELVDYALAARIQRARLQPLADKAFEAGDDELIAFAARPAVRDYARFRAVGDRLRTGWPAWPARLRDGGIRAADFDPADERYHIYGQWAAERQLAALTHDADAAELYLDMPLGVHPDSYDVWRNRSLFVSGASAGAPPDALFLGGQDWGFAPFHPEAMRRDGYAYLIAALRHQLRHARWLRLDHVMALYRLYWVPHGLAATEGVYVRYPADELFAVLTLESRRHGAAIVGEDLGTVPPAVRTRLQRHGIHRMWVAQFEAAPGRRPVLHPPAEAVMASLNTHDMMPFAAFWKGDDVREQRALDLIDDTGVDAGLRGRAELRDALVDDLDVAAAARSDREPGPALDAVLHEVALGPARIVLLSLEDLWLEHAPQNVPGTHGGQRPNWRRRLRHAFPGALARRDVVARVRRVAQARAEPSSSQPVTP